MRRLVGIIIFWSHYFVRWKPQRVRAILHKFPWARRHTPETQHNWWAHRGSTGNPCKTQASCSTFYSRLTTNQRMIQQIPIARKLIWSHKAIIEIAMEWKNVLFVELIHFECGQNQFQRFLSSVAPLPRGGWGPRDLAESEQACCCADNTIGRL